MRFKTSFESIPIRCHHLQHGQPLYLLNMPVSHVNTDGRKVKFNAEIKTTKGPGYTDIAFVVYVRLEYCKPKAFFLIAIPCPNLTPLTIPGRSRCSCDNADVIAAFSEQGDYFLWHPILQISVHPGRCECQQSWNQNSRSFPSQL